MSQAKIFWIAKVGWKVLICRLSGFGLMVLTDIDRVGGSLGAGRQLVNCGW